MPEIYHPLYDDDDKELWSARMGIAALTERVQDAEVLLLTDNMAVAYAISKGHSLNDLSNDILTN